MKIIINNPFKTTEFQGEVSYAQFKRVRGSIMSKKNEGVIVEMGTERYT